MKKITTLLTAIIGMAFMNQVSATHVTVEVPTAGQLSSLVQNANCDSITISGNLDGNDHAFAYCSNLKDITFPKSLVTIEYNAFYQSGLTEATLPDKLKNIGDAAFYECYNLKKVNFPEKLVSIGNSAFRQCNLSEIAFPDSLKAIGSNAFRYCQQLQKVTFPEKLETIGTHAFNDCFRLHTATLKGKTAPVISDNTFNYTKVFYVPEGAAQTYKEAPNWSNLVIIDGNTPKKITVTLTTAGNKRSPKQR